MRETGANPHVRYNPSTTSPSEVNLADLDPTFYVYLLAGDPKGRVAVCMTQDIACRVRDQKRDLHPRDYTSVHALHDLVHVEEHDNVYEAMTRYTKLRRMDQDGLKRLIDEENAEWRDLYSDYAA